MSGQQKSESKRQHLEITGVIQGVGFRPFIYNLARRYQLSGWVLNNGSGVTIEIQGQQVAEFINSLRGEQPPLARIDDIRISEIPPQNETGFTIRDSQATDVSTSIPPDSSVCSDCLTELFDPASRYYRYPFLNCTHCGPRYTITRKLPYDRSNTSMAVFKMCQDCKTEYDDPANRRFHAQPTACPVCGPKLSLSVKEILQRIKNGEILAIKGLGGFHLVCDATNETAVQKLRQRKNREEKPFAVMVANLASAETFVTLDNTSVDLLQSAQRPIVLLPKGDTESLAPSIAPGLQWLGLLLPYTPIHYLLFHEAAGRPAGTDWLQQPQSLCLVMTSANPGGEPLVIGNSEAIRRLGNIADTIVDHNRDILIRCDDTVMRVMNSQPGFIRRARSYVPQAIKLPHEIPSTLAVGGYLKNTVCITRGDEAFVSQHIGDMDNAATLRFFEETIDHLLSTLAVTPERVAHDLHPDFHSSRYAKGLAMPSYAIQHHHAHLAAVAAEHHITEPAIGLALDGFGLGDRNEAWGGELLFLDGPIFRRLGHLKTLKQPGGDVAAREPWRMAAGFLYQLGRGDEIATRFQTQSVAKNLVQLLQKNINAPDTSSCGRLFDTASGLLNIKPKASFEGQAPMLLEGMVTRPEVLQGGWRVINDQLDLTPLLAQLIDCEPVRGANLFHGTLIEALCDWSAKAAETNGIKRVLLNGGCFLNHVLASGVMQGLKARGLKPFLPQQTPPNDGGISLGQAWLAGQL